MASEIVAGTLAYMSPEQTGRMKRSMDTRSDSSNVERESATRTASQRACDGASDRLVEMLMPYGDSGKSSGTF